MVSAVLTAAALLGSAPGGCAATAVRYQAPPFNTLFTETPWVRAKPVAAGAFRQLFQIAGSPDGVYPSIVDVPAAGCWLLRLRTAQLAGVLVVRAVNAHG